MSAAVVPFTCTACGTRERGEPVSQAVGMYCHQCRTPHRFVDGAWSAVPAVPRSVDHVTEIYGCFRGQIPTRERLRIIADLDARGILAGYRAVVAGDLGRTFDRASLSTILTENARRSLEGELLQAFGVPPAAEAT